MISVTSNQFRITAWSTIVVFNILTWSTSTACCPICQTGSPCQGTQHLFWRCGSRRRQPLPCLSWWIHVLYCWESQAPSCLGKVLFTEFAMDVPPEWISYFSALGEGKLFHLHWDPVVLLQARGLWKHTIPEMEHPLLKERKGGGPGLAYPTPVHLLIPDSAAFCDQHIW